MLTTLPAFSIDKWSVIPISEHYRRGEFFAKKAFLLSGTTLFSVDDTSYKETKFYDKVSGLNGSTIFDIIVSERANQLIIVYDDGNIDFYGEGGEIINLPDYAQKVIMGNRNIKGISERDGKLYMSTGFGFTIVDAIKKEFEDTFYYDISLYKDGTYGERNSTMSEEKLEEINEKVKINGIAFNNAGSLAYNNGILITTNADPDFRNSLFNTPGIVSVFDQNKDEWTNTFFYEINPLVDTTAWFQGPTTIAIDPNDENHYFVGTFMLGIFEFRDGAFYKNYNAFNCEGISTILPGVKATRIGGMNVDNRGNLWFMNVGVENPLRCLLTSGKILSFPVKGYSAISNGFDRLYQSKNDPYKLKWILGVRPWQEAQAAIYYDGDTPEDLSDDENVSFNSLTDQDGNNIKPTYFNDLAEDKSGAIWLMTSSGPFVIDSQIDCYKSPGKVRRVKIPRNDGSGLADYLLANVDCSCIMVDAANRKWIGTKESGLYLLSADGLKQIEHFTTSNSPLPSNNIFALAYDDKTGTVFISCEGGLVTYITDAINGAEDNNNVICYPNPVRPEFSGNLRITGMKDQTKIKVCDINNTVVYSTVSEGGSVTWDLSTEQGKRLNSGVYIIYGTDTSGKNKVLTKLLVI
ncbi:MAG: hypothetical protein HUJ97_02880 [Bacteroidales bacterium]|nr:hypothetical protein [Bacteroidales bacterium]